MSMLMPWTAGLANLRREMDRLFERFFEPWEEFEALGEWSPRVDLSETKDAFVVKAEIPGVDQKDVSVSLEGQLLTIKGEKRQEKEEKDARHHRIERAWGAFARTMRLPAAVEGDKVSATFKQGVLTVTLPKAPGAKGTTIPVKAE